MEENLRKMSKIAKSESYFTDYMNFVSVKFTIKSKSESFLLKDLKNMSKSMGEKSTRREIFDSKLGKTRKSESFSHNFSQKRLDSWQNLEKIKYRGC